ncbi:vitamin K epoxide reductase family domain-containing protein [Phthorimaea operculella]|nr:vitamin K epoxide reductase family domain-containing protein [Phthorimaea operculella]
MAFRSPSKISTHASSVFYFRGSEASLEMSLGSRNRAIITTGILGVLASTYALFVELKADGNPGYKAMCDIGEMASCTRVLTSPYSKGFGLLDTGIPNPIFGVLYYCLMIFLSTFDQVTMARFQFLLSLAALSSSVYLAGLLIFVLHDICVVCISTYLVNGALVYLAYKKMQAIALKNK